VPLRSSSGRAESGPGILALILAVLIGTFLFQPEVDWISHITYDFVFFLFSVFVWEATQAKNERKSRVAKEPQP
jgi:hypothetical protein